VLEHELSDSDPSHYFNEILPPPPVPPPPEPDLRPRLVLVKQALSRRVRSGNVVRFRLRVRNRGDATARRVRVCDELPRGLVFASARGAQVEGRSACYRVRRLRPGASRTFVVRARAENRERARRICNVARRSARDVRVRRARACVRVLPALAQRGGGVTG
jgi:uncharacterized repeat protein (TIGR01451 family)